MTLEVEHGKHILAYKLCPGDVIELGIGFFKTKPRIGEYFEDYPLKIIGIRYVKNGQCYPKKWWQFWIRKKHWHILLRFEGDSENESSKCGEQRTSPGYAYNSTP